MKSMDAKTMEMNLERQKNVAAVLAKVQAISASGQIPTPAGFDPKERVKRELYIGYVLF